MAVYISLLRGINVSGHKKVPMADLKSLYEALHFTNITTYIQSGNVVFATDKKADEKSMAQEIEKGILKSFGFEVPVLVRRAEEVLEVVFQNPFAKDKNMNAEKLHVTFLAEAPQPALVAALPKDQFLPDAFEIVGKAIYLHCPNGYGQTKLTNTFFEHKLKVAATTRNWKTVNKLVELAKS